MSNSPNKIVDLFNPRLAEALLAWQELLSPERVLTGEELAKYDNCPSQTSHRICAALLPKNVDEVQSLVKIANTFHVHLAPISTGKNWGFGGANPVAENCAIVDLHLMNKIMNFDAEIGVITIEPGVTQKQIADYLTERNSPFMLSTIPAGPDCSYVGNALERGTGMMPPIDRFLSMTALKAVLPDGSFYQSLIADAGGDETDSIYKWGVGPFVDGIFSQGSFGVVIQASFALARIPEQITRFYFSPRPGATLEELIDRLRDVKQALRNVINTFEIGNRTEAVYGKRKLNENSSVYNYSNWIIYGCIHASKRVSAAAIADIKEMLKPVCSDFVFLTEKRLEKIDAFPLFYYRSRNWRYVVENRKRMLSYMGMYEGKPSIDHLAYAFSKTGRHVPTDMQSHMKDAGLIWFWPALPLRGKDAAKFLQILETAAKEFGMKPNLNMTIGSETHIIACTHIFFDPTTQTDRAKHFHKTLFDRCKKQGYLPHRPHIDAIDWYVDNKESTYYNLLRQLKRAIDPNNIMDPGRFSGQ